MKNFQHYIILFFISSFLHGQNRFIDNRGQISSLIEFYYKLKIKSNEINITLLNNQEWKDLLDENYYVDKSSNFYNNLDNYTYLNQKNQISVQIRNYATINDIISNGIEYYIFNNLHINWVLASNIHAGINLLKTTSNSLGDIYNYHERKKVFMRGNALIKVIYNGPMLNDYTQLSEELFQLAKKIDHKICELNGIPYDPNFPEKEDNDSEEDKEVKRKIADGTYKKIEDLPKPQSQNSDVKDLVKDPQEEKKVAKTESPIYPKIENSKSKIFIILGILFTIIFGRFLMIYKKRKKKNNETNN